jgi:membrane protein YqaA with SNARE-associated domain
MAKHKKQVLSGIVLVTILSAVAFGAFLIAEEVLVNESLQSLLVSFGYVGITVFATIAGLNVIMPIPAATFTPVFTAAGLSLPLIILALTLGTLAADFIGFLFGKVGRETIAAKYPKLLTRLEHLYTKKQHLLLPVVFLYAAFVPIPNEALVIPLALLGVHWQRLIAPLFFGNLINQAIYAYGFNEVFRFLF